MNCYHCHCEQFFRYGGYQEYDYIIFANTEAEALGMALERDHRTRASDWTIDLLAPEGCHYITERSN